MINFKITAGTALPRRKTNARYPPGGLLKSSKGGYNIGKPTWEKTSWKTAPLKTGLYATGRYVSRDFGAVRKNELGSIMGRRWQEELEVRLPERSPLNILDVGTGTGFFAILMAQLGHKVTGID